MGEIFISYRRHDCGMIAPFIQSSLEARLPDTRVFIDFDSIQGGSEFPKRIRKAIAHCDALLVMIGTQWLTATDDQGRRRLDREDDWVRMEIEVALDLDLPIIPLLVGEVKMPVQQDLPPSLRPLATRHALKLRPGGDSRPDLERLIGCLEGILVSEPSGPEPRASGSAALTPSPESSSNHPAGHLIGLSQSQYQKYRTEDLERKIRKAILAKDLENLQPQVAELLELLPRRGDLGDLLQALKYQDEARPLIREERNILWAAALMDKVPDVLRDPGLVESLRSLEQRASELDKSIKEGQNAGRLRGLSPLLEELERLTPGRDDVRELLNTVASHEEAGRVADERDTILRAGVLEQEIREILATCEYFDIRDALQPGVKADRLKVLAADARELRERLSSRLDELRLLLPDREFEPHACDATDHLERLGEFCAAIEQALPAHPVKAYISPLIARISDLKTRWSGEA
jgi:hypothetical protein